MTCRVLLNAFCGLPYSTTIDRGTITKGCLPPGLTLSSFGLLSGTPCSVGTYTFSTSDGCITSNYVITVYCQVIRQPDERCNPVSSGGSTTVKFAWSGDLRSALEGSTYTVTPGSPTVSASVVYSAEQNATFLTLIIGLSSIFGAKINITKNGCLTEISYLFA